jgi:hypothetical protein
LKISSGDALSPFSLDQYAGDGRRRSKALSEANEKRRLATGVKLTPFSGMATK